MPYERVHYDSANIYNPQKDPKYFGIPRLPLLVHCLDYPFGEENGYCELTTHRIAEWSHKYVINDAYELLKEEGYGGYGVSIMLRNSQSKDRLLESAKLITWSIYVIDYLKSMGDNGPSMAERLKEFATFLLSNAYDQKDTQLPTEPIFHMLGDAFQTMKNEKLTDLQQKRIVESIHKHLDNYCLNYVGQKNGAKSLIIINDMDAYICNRRKNSSFAIDLMIVAAEHVFQMYETPMEFDMKILSKPEMVNVINYMTDLIWIAHDLGAYTIQMIDNTGGQNFISQYSNSKKVHVNEAHDILCKMGKDIMKKFEESLNILMHSEYVCEYPDIAAFCVYTAPDLVYGIMQWIDVSGRYRVDRRTRREIEEMYLNDAAKIQILGKTYFD